VRAGDAKLREEAPERFGVDGIVGFTLAGRGRERPKPVNRSAITSKLSIKRSTTGRHACQWCPTPCSRTSGGPVPAR
jgi:hypothetical protein